MSNININRKNYLRDMASIIYFVVAVILGTLIINSFVFRSYSIVGRSMEDTLHDGEQVIVNRLPITWSMIKNETYIPKRGQIIVFENPKHVSDLSTQADRYLIKRVIGLPGDRVVVKDGEITVYNDDNPNGLDPNEGLNDKPRAPASGNIDTIVQDKTIFVSGDHRDGNNSYDSRNGLGNIQLYSVVGPVKLRLFPIGKFRLF